MKIGILVNNTSACELNYTVLQESNRINIHGGNAIVFTSNLSVKVVDTFGAIMHQSHLPYFSHGVVICTDFQTARVLVPTPLNADKFYYVYDLDWMYKPVHYDFVYGILSKIKLLVRSELHQKYLKNIFNLDSTIIPFNLETIWNLHDKTKTNLFKPM